MKRSLLLTALLTLVLAAGCSSPEERAERRLREAVDLREAGKAQGALFALEQLNGEFPDDSRILRQMGLTYGELGQMTNAAFFLDQASRLDPGNTELLREACTALIAAGDEAGAGDRLRELAAAAPEQLTAAEWIRLGTFRARRNEPQPAVDAYLRGIALLDGQPDSGTALAVGMLFIRLDNLAQAERWLVAAAAPGDSNSLPALLGLLEIHLRNQNWTEAEKAIAALDKNFPGALETSEWAGARAELERWRAAREAMKAQLAKAAEEAEKEAAEEESESGAGGGKEDVLRDLERAESLATMGAVEEEPAAEAEEKPAVATVTEESEPSVVYNPGIAIEPAEPEFGIQVTYGGPEDAPIDFLGDGAEEDGPAADGAAADGEDDVDSLLSRADEAMAVRDYDRAIRLYSRAVGLANERASLWNRLARAYLAAGQSGNAEMTALESMRLEPENPVYTLDYLRVIQDTKKPRDVLAEIEAAHARFPRQPEIAISLARAYERISRDYASARTMYRNFIAMAPDHPLVPEAEAALSRL